MAGEGGRDQQVPGPVVFLLSRAGGRSSFPAAFPLQVPAKVTRRAASQGL